MLDTSSNVSFETFIPTWSQYWLLLLLLLYSLCIKINLQRKKFHVSATLTTFENYPRT
jgi:hypothetical protein